jgi:tRNA modification GTPase
LRGVGSVEDPVLTNVRHAAALEGAVAALDRARASLPLSEEIVLEDLRAALSALGEITGEVANDELYDRIFSTFCIGK